MPGLAKRRPGWRLPDLPDGLAPDADDILFAVKKRETCPKWLVLLCGCLRDRSCLLQEPCPSCSIPLSGS